jgi:hypothetical protein
VGVFVKLWQADVERFAELKGSDWNWLSIDRAMLKAPLGGKDQPEPGRECRAVDAACYDEMRDILTEFGFIAHIC